MERVRSTDDAIVSQLLSAEAARLGTSVEKLIVAADEIGVAAQSLAPFPLDRSERATLAGLTLLPEQLRTRLGGRTLKFPAVDAINMVRAVADSFLSVEPDQQRTLLDAARKLLYCVHSDILTPAWRAEARKRKPTTLLYQLKVTVVGIRPAIWRRIQVRDCTLDRLHEHIQTTMGWTNSHLNHFEAGGQLYGDPQLMEGNFHEMNYRDSTITLLSSVLPEDGRRFRFRYEYDFGDSWEHEVLFEGCPNAAKGQKYPLCLEGERACPPEDVGGVSGYSEFLETIRDRDHRERLEMLEWAEGWFDPDEFDAATATKSMWKGIFDWRSARR